MAAEEGPRQIALWTFLQLVYACDRYGRELHRHEELQDANGRVWDWSDLASFVVGADTEQPVLLCSLCQAPPSMFTGLEQVAKNVIQRLKSAISRR